VLLNQNRGLGIGRQKLVNEIINANWNISEPYKKIYTYNELLFIIQELLYEEGKYYQQGTDYTDIKKYTVFREFVKYLLYRNLANYDSMLLISALKGGGKSSAAIMLAREWCQLLGIKFDAKRHIAYNNNDVMDRVDQLQKFEPLICDEAVRFACITGDTLIKTDLGLVCIKDLVLKKNFNVYSFNEKTQKEEIQKAEMCVKVREDIVYEVETQTGEKIKCTMEHKFLTPNGWKKLKELQEGDEILGI
jgi:hypothetical protein